MSRRCCIRECLSCSAFFVWIDRARSALLFLSCSRRASADRVATDNVACFFLVLTPFFFVVLGEVVAGPYIEGFELEGDFRFTGFGDRRDFFSRMAAGVHPGFILYIFLLNLKLDSSRGGKAGERRCRKRAHCQRIVLCGLRSYPLLRRAMQTPRSHRRLKQSTGRLKSCSMMKCWRSGSRKKVTLLESAHS